MATLNTLSVVITGNASQLSSVLGRASAEIDAFGRNAAASGGAGATALKGIAAGAGIAAVGLVYAASQAAQFEASMRNVSTIDATVRNNFAQTSAQVVELSKHLPQTAKELADGLYDISSSGFQGADSLKVLTASATAASAGLSTTANSAKAITAVLNAYGLGADQAQRVSDALFQTVNFGVVDFDQLTGVIADTVGSASAAGISIEQLGAAVATMTLSGLSASEAGTSLNRVLASLVKPNTDLKRVQGELGVSFTEELRNPAIGLHGVLQQLLDVTHGDRTAFSNLFSDIRASRGVLALTAADGRTYSKVLSEMGIASDNTGATQRALTEQSKGASFQFKILKNDFNAAAITVGEKVLPVLTKLASFASDAGHAIGSVLAAAVKALQPVWSALVDVGHNVVGIFHDLWQAAGPLVTGLAKVTFGAVVIGLRGVADAASATTGFLAHNKDAVIALGLAFALINWEAIVVGIARIGLAIGGGVLDGFAALALRAGAANLALQRLGAGSLLRGGLFAAGGAGIIFLLAEGFTAWADAADHARANIKALEDGLDLHKLQDVSTAINRIQGDFNKNKGGHLFDLGDPTQGILQDAVELRRLLDLKNQQQDSDRRTAVNVKALSEQYGISADKVRDLAAAHKVDLSGALNSTTKLENGHTVVVKGLIDQYVGLTGVLGETARATNPLRAAQDDLGKANIIWKKDLDETAKSVQVNIDVLKQYSAQQDVTAASIAQHVRDNLALLTHESADVQTLIAKGASPELLKKLVNEGPEYVHAFAQASTSVVRGASDDLKRIGGQIAGILGGVAQAANPADYQKKIDAQRRLDFLTYVQSVQDATSTAAGIIAQYSNVNAPAAVQRGLAAQRKKVLDAYLGTLSDPVRIAVLQAIGVSQTGSYTVAQSIVQALLIAKPSAVFHAQDLYQQVQGKLDQLHGKELQVILDDLASGNISKLQTDLARLGIAINNLPAEAIAFSGDKQSLVSGHHARGGKIPGFDPLGRDAAGLFALTHGEWVHNANVSAMYGDDKMRAVNEGRAEIVVPGQGFAAGGAVLASNTLAPRTLAGSDRYKGPFTEKPISDRLGAFDERVLARITQLAAEAAALSAGASGSAGPGQSFSLIIDYMRRSGIPFTQADPGLGRGGHSWHEQGDAVDFSGGDMNAMANYWMQVHGSLLELIHSPSWYVKNGAVVGGGFYGPDIVAAHYNHVHVAAGLAAMQNLLGVAGVGAVAAAQGAGSHDFGGSVANPLAEAIANAMMAQHGWNQRQIAEVDSIWTQESGFNPNIVNPNGGAYGIPQAYPPAHGHPYALGDIRGQVAWGINYIDAIGGPDAAYRRKASTGTYAQGGKVGAEEMAGGGAVGGPPGFTPEAVAYLKALAAQRRAGQGFLGGLAAERKRYGPLGFLQRETRLGIGTRSLAVGGVEEAFGARENGVWDQNLTDWIAVHGAKVGARGLGIRYLQLALKRPVTGILAPGDVSPLYKKVNEIAFPQGSYLQNLFAEDKASTQFHGFLQRIVQRGFAPLASALQDKGPADGLGAARQLANGPLLALQQAQAAAVRLATDSKYGDALKLASQLAQYGGKVGLLGLASRSGTAVGDVVGLFTQFPDVFKAMGATSKLLQTDMDRLKHGKQPVAAYAGGAYEIKRDHVAVVHQGETVLPRSYAEPWRRAQTGSGVVGGGLTVNIGANAISVGDGASMTQVKEAVRGAIDESYARVTSRARAGTGRRP